MASPYISDADPAAAVAALRARFPGVQIWHGKYTGRYWAIFAGEQLIEAPSAEQLGRSKAAMRRLGGDPQIVGGRGAPPTPHPARRADRGRWYAGPGTRRPGSGRPGHTSQGPRSCPRDRGPATPP
jgi:hypothetical protein